LPAPGVGDANIETGEVATIRDIAVAERVSERLVSRTMRLAYLSSIVLERLVAHRCPCSLSTKDLIAAAERPWELIISRKPGLASPFITTAAGAQD
jgi:hypothetical protein